MPSSTILTGRGMDYEDLYAALLSLKTKMTGLTLKLDLDATVTDVDYTALVAIVFPPAAVGREPGNGITSVAVRHQGLIIDYLKTVRTAFNTLGTKLDADNGGVTTYSTQAMSAIADVQVDGLLQAGMYEGTLAYWLFTYMTKFNAVLAALDLDANVADTNYAALWGFAIASTVDSRGIFASL